MSAPTIAPAPSPALATDVPASLPVLVPTPAGAGGAPVPTSDVDDVDVPTTTDDADLARAVLGALLAVEDPELPVGIVDLGLVRQLDVADGHVEIGLTYTSLSCPCVEMIREDVVAAVGAVSGVAGVEVVDRLEPWSRDDVTELGRALLRTVAVV